MAEVGGIAGEQLRTFIERIERLEDEKKDVQEQIKEVFSEAKGVGFDTRIMRQLLRLRRLRDADRRSCSRFTRRRSACADRPAAAVPASSSQSPSAAMAAKQRHSPSVACANCGYASLSGVSSGVW
jgi:uncharacterized protein (UPF0335 family)